MDSYEMYEILLVANFYLWHRSRYNEHVCYQFLAKIKLIKFKYPVSEAKFNIFTSTCETIVLGLSCDLFMLACVMTMQLVVILSYAKTN